MGLSRRQERQLEGEEALFILVYCLWVSVGVRVGKKERDEHVIVIKDGMVVVCEQHCGTCVCITSRVI